MPIKIRYFYTPRVTTSLYMYWVPVIHRLYIPQLNIFITCYYFSTKAVVYPDSGIQLCGKSGVNRENGGPDVECLRLTVLFYCVLSDPNYFIFFNFIQLEIALPPYRRFGCRIRMKWGKFRGLVIDHSYKCQYIVFLWEPLYKICLEQIKEKMADNPLDIPFQI